MNTEDYQMSVLKISKDLLKPQSSNKLIKSMQTNPFHKDPNEDQEQSKVGNNLQAKNQEPATKEKLLASGLKVRSINSRISDAKINNGNLTSATEHMKQSLNGKISGTLNHLPNAVSTNNEMRKLDSSKSRPQSRPQNSSTNSKK